MVVTIGIDVHKQTHCAVAVDDAGRQVPQQVGDMRADQLFRQLSKLRTQALQRRDGCEQGKKNIWPQRAPS